MRHRVTIQRYAETRSASGMVTETWADSSTVWASVEPISGREYYDAQRVNAEVTHTVKMRGSADVTPKDRLYYDSRYFLIESVMDLTERGREKVLKVREAVPSG